MRLEYNNHNIPFNSIVKFQGVDLSKVVFNNAKVWEKITPFTMSVGGDWGSTIMLEAEDPEPLYVPMTGSGARLPYVGINDTSDHIVTLSRAFSKPLSFKAFVNLVPTSFYPDTAVERNLVVGNSEVVCASNKPTLSCPSVNSLADLGLSLPSPQQVSYCISRWVTVERDLFPTFAAGQTQFATNLDDDEYEYSILLNDTMQSTLGDHGITAQRIFDLYPPTFVSADFSRAESSIYNNTLEIYGIYAVVHNNSYNTKYEQLIDYRLDNFRLIVTNMEAITAWQQATTDAAKFAWLQRFVPLSYAPPTEEQTDAPLYKKLAYCMRATSFYLEATDGEYTWRSDNLLLAFGDITFNPVFS